MSLVFTVVVIGPLTEEIVYRGLLYRAFRDRIGVPMALLLSGLIFAITHLELDHIVALWLIGVIFAWVTERSGSLLPAIAAHSLYNGLSLGLYLWSRGGQP
jgi:membrane protease YdiL (CAAX protease family)